MLMRLREDALPEKRKQQGAKHDEPFRGARPGAHIPRQPTCGSISLIGSGKGVCASQTEPASAWVQCGAVDMLYCLIMQDKIRPRHHLRNAAAQQSEGSPRIEQVSPPDSEVPLFGANIRVG
nr:hypothetical protein [uncultured Sphingomonas sp.]